jgi:hypothetical protein
VQIVASVIRGTWNVTPDMLYWRRSIEGVKVEDGTIQALEEVSAQLKGT